MRNIVVSLYPSLYPQLLLLIVYCSDKYESQKMRDDVVNDCVPALKFILTGLLQIKYLKKMIMLYTLMMIYSFIINIFMKPHLLLIKNIFLLQILKKINLDNNFDEDDLDTFIYTRFLAWHSKLKKREALKKR